MKLTGALAEKGLESFEAHKHHQGHEVPRIWVLVADREKAHIYQKTEKGLELIGNATRGHSMDHHGGGEHGHDPRDQKLHDKDMAFIAALAKWLDGAEQKKTFDRLVLVAPARTLGDIRSSLTKNVHTRLTAELDKDLTKMKDKEIEEHLQNVAWF